MATNPVLPSEQPERKIERSTIEFPYLDLDDSVEIAQTIKAINGTTCQREQLAARLSQSSTSGAFNLRLGTAKMFGLIAYERGTINLTPLGILAADSLSERSARVEAFLLIPLYRRLYEKFRGTSLPPTAGLEGEIVTLGVAPKQKERARQVFLRSAKQAGFFEFGNDRLVLPATGKPPQPTQNDASRKDEKPPNDTPKSPGRVQSHGAQYAFFIEGLLEKLPSEGAEWAKEDRAKWLKLAALAFDMMYVDKDNETIVVVECKKKGVQL